MQNFIHDDFLLHNEPARELYHNHAAGCPIFDYHCHLPPDDIAANKRFRNLYEIWLGGDHYKWRVMRANGVSETFCTGDAPDYEKFLAYARTVPYTLRNPLYHWTHLELKRYFGIDELLNEESAPRIWAQANEKLASPEMSVHGLLEKSRVVVVCTTDDPVDSLKPHQALRKSTLATRIYPAFRPDKALAVANPPAFNDWTDKLAAASGMRCDDLAGFVGALRQRHDFFHANGGRLSDHGIDRCLFASCTEAEASAIFKKCRAGQPASEEETEKFGSFLMLLFGRLDHEKGWTSQLHVGALRNVNTRLMRQLGPDKGFDSIGDFRQAVPMARYLDALDQEGRLPKTILYNLNPADNYLMAAMLGNFQDGTFPGKIQFGSAWWFLDQKEAMEWQINALSNLGLLRRFVGMLTDSRSFLSYTRHEYFRRVLCNLIGRDVVNGELPADMPLLGRVVREICYENAAGYFGLESGQVKAD